MKKLTAILFVTLSLATAVQANEIINTTSGITFSPFVTTMMSGIGNKEAREILNDTEEYSQSGKLSVSLNQKILDIQANEEVSTEEAIDILVESAQKILESK